MRLPPRHTRSVFRVLFRPELETLEDRTVPASVSVSGSTLTILGDATQNDAVQITDNGRGNVTARVTNTLGTASGGGSGIRRIVVKTMGCPDKVTYRATAARSTNLERFEVNLGTHADRFTATFAGVNPRVALNCIVLGGDGADAVTVGTSGNYAGTVSIAIRTDAGADTVVANLSGVGPRVGATSVGIDTGAGRDNVVLNTNGDVAGTLRASVTTGDGDDSVQGTVTGNVGSGITAEVSFQTGAGNDVLALTVNGTLNGTCNATLDGGPENDTLNLQQQGDITAGGAYHGTVNGGAGDDRINIKVGGRINGRIQAIANGGDGNDQINGTKLLLGGTNTFNPLQAPQSDMVLNGDAGDDVFVTFFDRTMLNVNFFLTVNGGPGTDTGGGLQPDTKTGIEIDNFIDP